jgi:pheromone a factor receptor
LSIRAFWTKRLQFKKLLSANKDLNVNRYLRVIFFSAADILHGIPLTSYVLYFNVRRIQPYRGFESLHATAGEIVQFPAAVWHNDSTLRFQAEIIRWATLVCSFTFIVFFSFTPDSRNNYRSAISSVAKRVGVCPSSTRPLATRSTL